MDVDEVRQLLSGDELDYPSIARRLDPDDARHLITIARGDDPMLASKAVYLAGMVDAAGTREVLEYAAAADEAIVRVAAAATLGNVEVDTAVDVGRRLLDDDDAGVRHTVVDAAVASAQPEIAERLHDEVERHPDDDLRTRAPQLRRGGPEE